MKPVLASAVLVSTALAVAAPLAQSSKETAEQLAGRIQARYDTIRDFEADFVQTYQGGLLRTKTTEQGTVAIKRPGRMRWVYTKPERKEFVSDGQRSTPTCPRQAGHRQPDAGRRPDDAGAVPHRPWPPRPRFPASSQKCPALHRASIGLKLVPKQADPELEWLILASTRPRFRSATSSPPTAKAADRRFTFTNLKENRNLVR